jgi:hypothetical protein
VPEISYDLTMLMARTLSPYHIYVSMNRITKVQKWYCFELNDNIALEDIGLTIFLEPTYVHAKADHAR